MNERIRLLDEDILSYDRRIEAMVRDSVLMRRIVAVCGVGPITASVIVASVGDAKLFRNGRQFAAWLGLVPRQYSTGGKAILGRITKHGDVYLRTLLIHGARSALITLSRRTDRLSRWAAALGATTRLQARVRGDGRQESCASSGHCWLRAMSSDSDRTAA